MKKWFVVLAVVIVACIGCGKVDHKKAETLVIALVQKEDSDKYNETSKYYSEEFNQGESVEARAQKYRQLKEAYGDVVSMQCISVKDSTDLDDRPIVQLIYRVKRTKVTTLEAFSVVSQNGDYKVEQDDIKQE
jgi:putative lipoic acid-binding regulatory protein